LSIDENSQFEGSSRRVENPTEPSSSVDAKGPQKASQKKDIAPAPIPSIDAELADGPKLCVPILPPKRTLPLYGLGLDVAEALHKSNGPLAIEQPRVGASGWEPAAFDCFGPMLANDERTSIPASLPPVRAPVSRTFASGAGTRAKTKIRSTAEKIGGGPGSARIVRQARKIRRSISRMSRRIWRVYPPFLHFCGIFYPTVLVECGPR
jgi:hypothetical protein